jgi:plastocyanin
MPARFRWPALALGALVLAGLGAAGWWLLQPSAEARQLVYSVPAGTAARVAAGEPVAALPETITLTLGQRDILVIQNDDSEPVQIGPFKLEPGQRYTQQYYNRGSYDLICSVHRSQRLRIVVE